MLPISNIVGRERELLQEWEEEKRAISANSSATTDSVDSKCIFSDGAKKLIITVSPSLDSLPNAATITASLFASVWKIKGKAGDVIQSDEDVLIILEAMKTEIPICAGEDNVGKTIKRVVIKEGAMVRPGDALIILN
jgi:biotin carboxyl carrier protein